MNKYDPQFQYIQGHCCLTVLNDLEGAKERLSYAAKKGHIEAQYLLGQIYEREQAYRTAAKWYRLAGWQGRLADAQYRLGHLYLRGLGVKHDETQAIRWLRGAAEGRNVSAMYDVGVMLRDRNAVEAYAWLSLARGRKSPEAAKAAQSLRPSLTPEQVAEAKVVAAKLRSQFRRPEKRRKRAQPGPKYCVGKHEICGSVCEWDVETHVQARGDGRWTLYIQGEDRRTHRDGPMYPEELPQALEDYGLDAATFLAQVRTSDVPVLKVLAKEIEEAMAAAEEEARQVEVAEPPVVPALPALSRHPESAAEVPQAQTVLPPGWEAMVLLDPTDPMADAERHYLRSFADTLERIQARGETPTDTRTYVDDGDLRCYRHPPEPVRAFEAVLNIGDRASNLTFGTPDGCHEADIEFRAHANGAMTPVVRLHGEPTPDGRLQVIVTNMLTGEQQVIAL